MSTKNKNTNIILKKRLDLLVSNLFDKMNFDKSINNKAFRKIQLMSLKRKLSHQQLESIKSMSDNDFNNLISKIDLSFFDKGDKDNAITN